MKFYCKKYPELRIIVASKKLVFTNHLLDTNDKVEVEYLKRLKTVIPYAQKLEEDKIIIAADLKSAVTDKLIAELTPVVTEKLKVELTAKIEKELRPKVEKELKAKIKAEFDQKTKGSQK